MKLSKKRIAIGALGAVGVLDSLYMLAYHEGLIDSLICPFFGEGCNIVGRSNTPGTSVYPMPRSALWATPRWQPWRCARKSHSATLALAVGGSGGFGAVGGGHERISDFGAEVEGKGVVLLVPAVSRNQFSDRPVGGIRSTAGDASESTAG